MADNANIYKDASTQGDPGTLQAPKAGDALTWRHIGFVVTSAAMAFLGTALWLNSAGIFYRSVADEFGCGLGQVSMYISVSFVATMVLLPIGGRIMEAGRARALYVVANVCLGLAFLLNASAQNIWMMYAAGVLGAGCLAYDMYLMPALVGRWFKKRTGFVTGLAASMAGAGAAIFNIVGNHMIQNFGWRSGYILFGALVLCVLVPLIAVFVRSNPEDVGVVPYGAAEAGSAQAGKALEGAEHANVLKSPAFLMLGLMGICGGLVTMMSQYMASFAVSVGYETIIGASMASAAMVGNMFFKIFLGAVADKSLTAAVAGGMVFPVVAFAGLILIGGSNMAAVVFMAFLYGGGQPSNTVILALVARRLFGERDYDRIWSSISPFCAAACVFGATVWGWIYDGTGSFVLVFATGAVLVCIRFVAYLVARKGAAAIPWLGREAAVGIK